MLNLSVIGQRIIDLRKQRDMNQNELADALFVTRQAVSKWEMGRSLPSIEVMIDLTKLFGISIDYLLDSSDLQDDDYQAMFVTYPRESVIYKFLNSENPTMHLKDIFYLLTPKERTIMINQIVHGQINIDILSLWPYASVKERKYILESLLSKGADQDIQKLYALMNTEEQVMVASNSDYHSVVYQRRHKKKEEI